jgi:diaminopimelate decarboxylase
MSYPLQFFGYQDGILSADGVSLNTIATQIGTPVYIYSERALLTPLRQLKKSLAELDATICFAMKSNSNLSILKTLCQEGAGLDIVSGGELYRASLVGVAAEKVVFSGVGKTQEEMQSALFYNDGRGIRSFNIESIQELKSLNELARSKGKRPRVALRFNPDVNPKTHPYISTGLRENKFGLNRTEIIQIAQNIGNFESLTFSGISIHIGSQLTDLAPIEDAFQKTVELIEELDSILPAPLQWVDLGGGIGITYKDEHAPSIKDYCDLIKRHFLVRKSGHPPLQIMIEPGRMISGNSGVLITQVLYRKTREDKDFLVLDAAMNDLMRPALYGSHHEIVPVTELQPNSLHKKTNIVGPVCESSDCFANDCDFPEYIEHGDLLAILSAGAYGMSMSSTYNSRPRAAEVLIQKTGYKVIRKRETYLDLVQQELV